jgi:SAM-dependent methyltransferase
MADEFRLSEHAARTRAMWDEDAPNWVALGRKAWASRAPYWGIWEVPEEEVQILPDVRGLDIVDLGCGTAYWCAWLARLGARPVGLDVSEAQLETARALQREHGVEFPLVHASAEAAPLPDRSFDLVLSEYGAAIWCDPYVWIPEAQRLLRPGGQLIFLCNSILAMLCSPASEEPAGETLVRPQFGLHRIDWPDTEGPDFHLPHGEILRLLRQTGFDVEALHELRAPAGPEDELRFYLRRGWARRWPGEQGWVARRRPD